MTTFNKGDVLSAPCRPDPHVICEVEIIEVLSDDNYLTTTKYYNTRLKEYDNGSNTIDRSSALMNKWLTSSIESWSLKRAITITIDEELFTL